MQILWVTTRMLVTRVYFIYFRRSVFIPGVAEQNEDAG